MKFDVVQPAPAPVLAILPQRLFQLPDGAREYLEFISEHTGAPIALAGVGPGREQVVWTEAGRQTLIARQSSPDGSLSPR